MPITGYIAYRYKRRYYATFIPRRAFPDILGDWFAAKIPRNQDERHTWVKRLIREIYLEVAWRREQNIPDDEELEATYTTDPAGGKEFVPFHNGRPLLFREIIDGNKYKLHPGEKGEEEWTYVIDLDSRAFTINALMHFRLDCMPPGTLNSRFWRAPAPKNDRDKPCILTFAHLFDTPRKHIGTVARWPSPDFDVSQTHEKYTSLAPVVLTVEDWGVPTLFDDPTAAHTFSYELVRTILLDNAEALSNPDMGQWRMFGVRCWQLLSATALCHLQLPTQTEGDPRSCHSLRQLKRATSWNCLTPHYDTSEYEDLDHRYHWFRGCLIVFCPRLDDVRYVEHETVQMVENLRKYGRTTGIGIIFSGRHILAVAVDGDTVRCSRPLLFHDKEIRVSRDGFLLAMHLLSPLLATNKYQCLGKPAPNLIATASRARLPKELIRLIMFHLDHDTYQGIHAVSRVFRELYIQYPRVGDYILLAQLKAYTYRVHDTTTGSVTATRLDRPDVNRPGENLAYSFQHVHRGPYNLDRGPDKGFGILYGRGSDHEVRLSQISEEWEGESWPQIRLQVLDGTWCFVEPTRARSNFPGDLEYEKDRDRYPDALSYLWCRWQGFDK
ncbi:hypothetical protein FS749_007988 [Ceratobasidium sp. UAMH 11750]|nr:hypothetical protein FS749_007988 [Ceratobasidium sp. UAMH 11750]